MKKEKRIEISDDLKVKLISMFVFRDFLRGELHDQGDVDFDGDDLQSAANYCISVLRHEPCLLDGVVGEIDVDSRVKFSSMDDNELLKSITPLLIFTYHIDMAVEDCAYKGYKLSDAMRIFEYHLSRFAEDPSIIDRMKGVMEDVIVRAHKNETYFTGFGLSNN